MGWQRRALTRSTAARAELVHGEGTAHVAMEHRTWGRMQGLMDEEVICLAGKSKVIWTLAMRRTSCGAGVVMQGVEESRRGTQEMFMFLSRDDPAKCLRPSNVEAE